MRNDQTECRVQSAECKAKRGGPRGWSSLCTLHSALCTLFIAGCQPTPPPTAGSVVAGRSALQARQFDAAAADADDYLRGQPHGPDAAEADYIKGYAMQNKAFADRPDGRRRDALDARQAFTAGLAERPAGELAGYLHAGLSTVALYADDFPTAIEQAQAAIPLVARPEVKAGLLYNVGLAQQRLNRFGDADQTFEQVQQQYPGTPAAAGAAAHLHQTMFYVELAHYASPADADRAVASLRASGAVVSRRSDAAGLTVVTLGPFSTYTAARQQQLALLGTFPTAVVGP